MAFLEFASWLHSQCCSHDEPVNSTIRNNGTVVSGAPLGPYKRLQQTFSERVNAALHVGVKDFIWHLHSNVLSGKVPTSMSSLQ